MSKLSTSFAVVTAGALAFSAAPANAAQTERTGFANSAHTVYATAGLDANDICTLMSLGSGGVGLAKTAASRGAGWVGIGASIGCWAYAKADAAMTTAQKKAQMRAAYYAWQKKSTLDKLADLGWTCWPYSEPGGPGGTDSLPKSPALVNAKMAFNVANPDSLGPSRIITVSGSRYTCNSYRD